MTHDCVFAGLECHPKKAYTQSPEVHTRLTQACLAGDVSSDSRATVTVKTEGVVRNVCTLLGGVCESQTLDLIFAANIPITFSVKGNAVVHLSGYVDVPEEEEGGMYLSDEELAAMYGAQLGNDDDESDDGMDEETRANTLMNAMFSGRAGMGGQEDDEEDDGEYLPSGSDEDDHVLPRGVEEIEEDDEELTEDEVRAYLEAAKESKMKKGKKEKKESKKDKKRGRDADAEQAEDGKRKNKKQKKMAEKNTGKAKVVTLKNGLKYIDVQEGKGKAASNGRSCTLKYIGKLSNGKKFDSGKRFTFRLGAGEVIEGWDQGIKGMKIGGKRTLIIPPHLGYGSQRSGPIPPNSTLTFDVVLKNIQ